MKPHIQQIDDIVRKGDELHIDDRSRPLTVTGVHTRTPSEETPEEYISDLNTLELEGNGTKYHLRTTHQELEQHPVLYTESEWEETTGDDAVGCPYTYTGDGEEVESVTFGVRDLRRVPRNARMRIDGDEYTFEGVCVGKEVDEPDYTRGYVSLVFEGDWWEEINDVVDTEVLDVQQALERRTGNPKPISVLGTVFEDGDRGTVEERTGLETVLRATLIISSD